MLSTVLQYLEEHCCPHCGNRSDPLRSLDSSVTVSLGFQVPLFVAERCLPTLFVKGWDYIANQYGHVGSYRYMQGAQFQKATT